MLILYTIFIALVSNIVIFFNCNILKLILMFFQSYCTIANDLVANYRISLYMRSKTFNTNDTVNS